MECVVVAIVLLTGLILGVLLIGLGFNGGGAQQALRMIAHRFQGRVIGGILTSQSVEFRAEGVVTCEFISHQGRRWLEVKIIPVNMAAAGMIQSLPHNKAFIQQLPGYSYFTRFRDGDGHEHVLYHHAVQDGYQILSDGVRQQVGLLRQMPFTAAIEIRFENNWLIVRKLWASIVPDNAVRFVQQCLSLRDQMHLLSSGAIAFVNESAPVNLKDAVCKVCGEEIAQSEIVMCSRCRTPHHQDCWKYSEGCSVYGCGGKQAVPMKAR